MKKFMVYRESAPKTDDKAVLKVFADGRKRMRFDAALNFGEKDGRSFDEVKESNGLVVDYRNVTIKGYLSTFQHVTPSDRDGDYVQRGAFAETIPHFMRNPVMLANHSNSVSSLVGAFTTVKEDELGLYVEGRLSNSPSEFVKDVRFKVAEGSLRTMSMGGVFHYLEDGRGIFKVSLWKAVSRRSPRTKMRFSPFGNCPTRRLKSPIELGA
jgi:HK97 family phage prohead protease